MKAIEYFEKFIEPCHKQMEDDSITNALIEMFLAFSEETTKLIEMRHARSNHSLIGILNEMNDKWNAVINIESKKYGASIAQFNGFKQLWLKKMPELTTLWK